MALACNPELLIADEPTTALDVTIQAQILELIKRLQAELGMAVIIITHDLGVVAGMADRVMVMYAGRVVEEGTTHEIFNKPRMPYTIGLLKSIPRLDDAHDRRLEPIRGMPPDLITLGEVCSFSARCDYFKAGTCDTHVPPLRAVGENHKAACFFDITTETPTNAVAS
jgi:oligopeptide transport system ATP-binding protein